MKEEIDKAQKIVDVLLNNVSDIDLILLYGGIDIIILYRYNNSDKSVLQI